MTKRKYRVKTRHYFPRISRLQDCPWLSTARFTTKKAAIAYARKLVEMSIIQVRIYFGSEIVWKSYRGDERIGGA